MDSVCPLNLTPKLVYFMLYSKCFAVDKIASFDIYIDSHSKIKTD